MTIARIQTAFKNLDGSDFNGYMVARLTKTIVTVEAETVVRQEWDFIVKDGQAYNDAAGTELATLVVTEAGSATPGNVPVSIWQKTSAGKLEYWGTVIVPAETGGLPVVLEDLAPVAPDEPVTYQAVRTFNSRAGDVTLTDGDVSTALGFTPGDATAVTANADAIAANTTEIAENAAEIAANTLAIDDLEAGTVKPQGAYNALTPYAVNDSVTYGGRWWVCLQAGTGQTPAIGSAYWEPLGGHLTASPADLRTPAQALEEANIILPCLRLLVGELETVMFTRNGSGAVTSALANGRAFPITRDGSGLITRIGGLSALPAWTRATPAYGQDGTEYAANAPRYRYGRNLLTKNQSTAGGEGDTTGFSPMSGAVISRETAFAYRGTSCIKVVTPGTVVQEGVVIPHSEAFNVAPSPISGNYAGQMRVRGAGNLIMWVRINYTDSTSTNGALSYFTASSTWQRITPAVPAVTAGKVVASVQLFCRTDGAQAVTFYIADPMLEDGAAATAWTEGGPQGGFVEDGTTNLLTANQSSIETDTTGFSVIGTAVISRSSTWALNGTYSLKVDTAGNISTDYARLDNVSITNGTTYTTSATIYNPGASSITVSILLGGYAAESFTVAAGEKKRVSSTRTAASTTTTHLRFAEATGQTFYLDCIQFEAKSYATSWTLGGTTRNADHLTAPIDGLMRASKGAVTIRFKMDVVKASQPSMLLDAGGTSASGFYAAVAATGKVQWAIGDGASLQTLTSTTTIAAGTIYEVTLKWDRDGQTVKLFVNGNEEATFSGPISPTLYTDLVYLGAQKGNSTRYLNGTIYHARFFDEMDDTEAAKWTPTYRPSTWPSKQIAVLDFEGSLAYRAKTATLAYVAGLMSSITVADEAIAA